MLTINGDIIVKDKFYTGDVLINKLLSDNDDEIDFQWTDTIKMGDKKITVALSSNKGLWVCDPDNKRIYQRNSYTINSFYHQVDTTNNLLLFAFTTGDGNIYVYQYDDYNILNIANIFTESPVTYSAFNDKYLKFLSTSSVDSTLVIMNSDISSTIFMTYNNGSYVQNPFNEENFKEYVVESYVGSEMKLRNYEYKGDGEVLFYSNHGILYVNLNIMSIKYFVFPTIGKVLDIGIKNLDPYQCIYAICVNNGEILYYLTTIDSDSLQQIVMSNTLYCYGLIVPNIVKFDGEYDNLMISNDKIIAFNISNDISIDISTHILSHTDTWEYFSCDVQNNLISIYGKKHILKISTTNAKCIEIPVTDINFVNNEYICTKTGLHIVDETHPFVYFDLKITGPTIKYLIERINELENRVKILEMEK